MMKTTTKLPIRERRLAEARRKLSQMRARREGAIALLVRSELAIKDLERQVRRYEKTVVAETDAKISAAVAHAAVERPQPAVLAAVSTMLAEHGDDLAVPEFLRRKQEGDAKDAAERKALEQEIAEQKRTKSTNRIAKMKAKKSGAMNAMPLSGKDALRHIQQLRIASAADMTRTAMREAAMDTRNEIIKILSV